MDSVPTDATTTIGTIEMPKGRARRLLELSCFLVVSLCALSCSPATPTGEASEPQSPQPTGVDAVLAYTNRWIPNSSIDLMSPEGTFIRAAMESINRVPVGRGTGMEAILDGSYPGFSRAFNNVRDPEKTAGLARKDQASFGTMYWEVLKFEKTEGGFTAGVCSYGGMTATKVWNGYKSSGTVPSGSATLITFGPDTRLPVGQQIAPKANQKGPDRAPATDVFGTWVLTKIIFLGADLEIPQCSTKLAPGIPADAPNDYYVMPTPPPTLPPFPGWPSAGSA